MATRGQGGLFDEPAPIALRGKGDIYIGTSGFSFPDWEGVFYPPRLPKREWLAYYAREFPTVEINATYYRLPTAATFQGMVDHTPGNYPFWVKLPGDVTHGDGDPSQTMAAFQLAVEPLRACNRLAGTLAQFPNSFRLNLKNFEYIRRIKALCGDLKLAVEFRRDEWQCDVTRRFLDDERLVNVIVDLPKITGLPVTEDVVTSDIGYIRFHGRNSETWYNPAKGDRYDYEYSIEEIKSFIDPIKRVDEKANATFIFFNNCHMGQAVKNARMLRELLGQQFQS